MGSKRQSVCHSKLLGLILGLFLMLSGIASAQTDPYSLQTQGAALSGSETIQGTSTLYRYSVESAAPGAVTISLKDIAATVKDNFDHSGLAFYLENALPVEVSGKSRVSTVDIKDEAPTPTGEAWAGYKGRFKAVLVRAPGAEVSLTGQDITLSWPSASAASFDVLSAVQDTTIPPQTGIIDVRKLQYSHLPRWLGGLCHIIEWIFRTLHSVTGLSWALSLILLAFTLRLIMTPVSMLTTRLQDKADTHKKYLEPIFADIKKNYKDEKAHTKTMAAYKERRITPYYSLKPLLGVLISLPVLIAVFNMLGEIEPLTGASLFYIDSLAYPDQLSPLPFSIPLLGSNLNAMPFLMTFVTIISAFLHDNSNMSAREAKRQRRNLYLMAALFFVLFYTFPSGMVLYWTVYSAIPLMITKIKALISE